MNQSNNRNKLLILGLGLLVIASFILFGLSSKDKTPSPAPSNTSGTVTQTPNVVSITNSEALKPYADATKIKSIESILYSKVKQTNQDAAKHYDGQVRDWSFRIATKNDTTTTTFLVDIPSLKQTYQVSFSNSVEGFGAVYALCPTPQQLIYPAFSCQEGDA